MDEYENLEEVIKEIFESGYDTCYAGYGQKMDSDDIEYYAKSIKETLEKGKTK